MIINPHPAVGSRRAVTGMASRFWKCPTIYENIRRFMEMPDGLRKYLQNLWVPAPGRAMPAPTRRVPFLSIFGFYKCLHAANAGFATVFGFCVCLHAATARRGPTGAYCGPMWASAPTNGISTVRLAGGARRYSTDLSDSAMCTRSILRHRSRQTMTLNSIVIAKDRP